MGRPLARLPTLLRRVTNPPWRQLRRKRPSEPDGNRPEGIIPDAGGEGVRVLLQVAHQVLAVLCQTAEDGNVQVEEDPSYNITSENHRWPQTQNKTTTDVGTAKKAVGGESEPTVKCGSVRIVGGSEGWYSFRHKDTCSLVGAKLTEVGKAIQGQRLVTYLL